LTWTASGTAIFDEDLRLRKFLLLGASLDDLAIRRARQMFDQLPLRLLIQTPASYCQDGVELIERLDELMARWRARPPGRRLGPR
jgi:hypothetical protein